MDWLSSPAAAIGADSLGTLASVSILEMVTDRQIRSEAEARAAIVAGAEKSYSVTFKCARPAVR